MTTHNDAECACLVSLGRRLRAENTLRDLKPDYKSHDDRFSRSWRVCSSLKKNVAGHRDTHGGVRIITFFFLINRVFHVCFLWLESVNIWMWFCLTNRNVKWDFIQSVKISKNCFVGDITRWVRRLFMPTTSMCTWHWHTTPRWILAMLVAWL